MSTERLTRDDELATAAEDAFLRLLLDGDTSVITDEDGLFGPDMGSVETYEAAMLLTSDRGLIVKLPGGRELHLTITAYGPAR